MLCGATILATRLLIAFQDSADKRSGLPPILTSLWARVAVTDKALKSGETAGQAMAIPVCQPHASKARRPARTEGVRGRSRMVATRHEAQSTAREPGGGTSDAKVETPKQPCRVLHDSQSRAASTLMQFRQAAFRLPATMPATACSIVSIRDLPTARASNGGTALPIWQNEGFIAPANSKPSGKD